MKRSIRTNSFLCQVSEATSRTAHYANILLVGGPEPQEDVADVGHRQQPGLQSISCLRGYLFRGLATNPFLPFPVGGAAVVKCDESKFNHKAKVNSKLAKFK